MFNIAGRFVWASLSDLIGRKVTYFVFFVLGFLLYASIPTLGNTGNLALFVIAFCIIVSMYGGGFAAIPAYLADVFGTQMVGAIHGRLLTAWATAGVLGPVLVNYIREVQIANGVPKAQAYDVTMYILAGLLVLGFLCNLLVKPVSEDKYMTEDELAAERKLASDRTVEKQTNDAGIGSHMSGRGQVVIVILAWAAVGIPLAYGLWNTVMKAAVLFA